MLMSFGMFGSIFLLAQFLQFVRFYSPLEAGAAILPWTLAPMFVAPIAGALSDRIGGGLLMGVGLTLQAIGLAWLGLVSSTTVEYAALVAALPHLGHRHGPLLRPGRQRRSSARCRPEEEGQASGAGNAIRELGGVFGVAVLAAVFTRNGSLRQPAGLRGRHGSGRAHRGRLRGPRARWPPSPSRALAGRRRSSRSARSASPQMVLAAGDPVPVYVRIDE